MKIRHGLAETLAAFSAGIAVAAVFSGSIAAEMNAVAAAAALFTLGAISTAAAAFLVGALSVAVVDRPEGKANG